MELGFMCHFNIHPAPPGSSMPTARELSAKCEAEARIGGCVCLCVKYVCVFWLLVERGRDVRDGEYQTPTFVCMCMCVCVCVCACACALCVCVCVFFTPSIVLASHLCHSPVGARGAWMYACTYLCTCTHAYRITGLPRARTYLSPYLCIYIYTHTYACQCMSVCV